MQSHGTIASWPRLNDVLLTRERRTTINRKTQSTRATLDHVTLSRLFYWLLFPVRRLPSLSILHTPAIASLHQIRLPRREVTGIIT